MKAEPSRNEHRRHRRKYAEGELEPERSFYFKGSDGMMNLRAQNLNTFVQLAEGVDQNTWLFHLRQGDYSKWLRSSVKDSELADQIEGVEKDASLSYQESRQRIKDMILQRYTAPT